MCWEGSEGQILKRTELMKKEGENEREGNKVRTQN